MIRTGEHDRERSLHTSQSDISWNLLTPIDSQAVPIQQNRGFKENKDGKKDMLKIHKPRRF